MRNASDALVAFLVGFLVALGFFMLAMLPVQAKGHGHTGSHHARSHHAGKGHPGPHHARKAH